MMHVNSGTEQVDVEDDDNEKYVIPQNNAGNRPPRAAWNHTVSIFDGTEGGVSGGDTENNRAAYLNGNRLAITSTDSQQGTMISSDQPLILGNKSSSSAESYRGIIDEVRLSTVTRSAAWVKATYDTIANNAAFVAYGAARQNNKGGLTVFIR